MDYNSFNSKKYIILVVIICILFAILTIKAFDYLPESDSNRADYSNRAGNHVVDVTDREVAESADDVDDSDDDNNEDDDSEQEDSEYNEQHKSGHIDFMPKSYYENSIELDEIPAPKGTVEEEVNISENAQTTLKQPNDELAMKHIISGKSLKLSNDISKALDEFQQAIDTADDNEIKAIGYESIAEIYASQRKFGTALSFANKANSIAPSNSRELLIARINFSAGQTNEAVIITNNLMKKSFK